MDSQTYNFLLVTVEVALSEQLCRGICCHSSVVFGATAFVAPFLVKGFLRHHKPLFVSDCALATMILANNSS